MIYVVIVVSMEDRNTESYVKYPRKLVFSPFVNKNFENCFLATQAE